jgi:predicted DsbA family dithiol-disulfide isomerase
MHDLLFNRQSDLTFEGLTRDAADLGLDVDRFAADLASRRHARRVARDVETAERSGVAGTPTFFINGHRLQGAYDLGTLTNKLRLVVAAGRDAAPR